ncbi:MAG: cytochrome c oxidase accessory protein CcoG [Rhodospirillaceae bacterium]|jgi:cytochrome c oxidase accessory protein FixG|nr:cytochrome c oxidase accessory protein CcoG [Rhodospirillaceae bacterium]MBT5752437.1 cytochrome c oxidase accessory protein CcoG [Rhodospirillaceae bacterium]
MTDASRHDDLTVDAESVKQQKAKEPFYAPHIKVYPKKVDGIFRRLKWVALVILLGIYYIVPWLRWDRGPGVPDQAVLFDFAGQRAYVLWIQTWPQEIYYLAGLLILAAIGLFFVTSLFGRLWCGYACPQTVWTDLFMLVERMIEGGRSARIRLDKGPWTSAKVIKKITKHISWLVISFLTGGAWIMYFYDAPTLVHDVMAFQVPAFAVFFVLMFTATTYLLGGISREQVCTYMCPWPRFQSAMFDEDTMIVTYEKWRGEPRAPHKAGTSWDGRGDCIDCNQCVAACPTGIDIRDGSQLECIGCGLCIDACNSIMDRVDLPRGLIKFDTAACQVARTENNPTTYRLVRPRTVLYASLFVLVGCLMAYQLFTRPTFGVNLLRDRNPLFVKLSDGDIRNGYTLKILNMVRRPREFTVSIQGVPDGILSRQEIGGSIVDEGMAMTVTAPSDQIAAYRIFIHAPHGGLTSDAVDLTFQVRNQEDGESISHQTIFRGPTK